MIRSIFHVSMKRHRDRNFAVIVDDFSPDNPTMTVTNDIENVIAHMKKKMFFNLNGFDHIIYRDSYGQYDGIALTEDHQFKHFINLLEVDEVAAMDRMIDDGC